MNTRHWFGGVAALALWMMVGCSPVVLEAPTASSSVEATAIPTEEVTTIS